MEGNEAPIIKDLVVDAFWMRRDCNLFTQVGEVFGTAGGIGDKVEGFGTETRDDGVVDYAACARMEEAGQSGVVGLEGGDG